MRFIAIVLASTLATTSSARAAEPVETYPDALADRDRRDRAVIASWIKYFVDHEDSRFKDFYSSKNYSKHGLAMVGALLFYRAYYQELDDEYTDLHDKVFGINDAKWNNTIQPRINTFLAGMSAFLKVGSSWPWPDNDRDFDMVLLDMASLLYAFKDTIDPHTGEFVLSNDQVRQILCMDSWYCQHSTEPRPYLGFRIGDDYFTDNGWWLKTETENHVLMIYTWNYLVTAYVMWAAEQAGPGPTRYHPDYWDWRHVWESWILGSEGAHEFEDYILQALGRPLHSGFFETNGRPYSGYSLAAILSLALYAHPEGLGNDALDVRFERVRQAATNALSYATAKFAYQSLRSKRNAPFRRRVDYGETVDFYSNYEVVRLLGLLSGAVEYDDCIRVSDSCPMQRADKITGSTRLLWAAVGRYGARLRGEPGYELPEPIHRQMFGRGPYFARMQAHFTRGQYERSGEAEPYFTDEHTVYESGEFRGSPELYFGTEDLVLAAGGHYKNYYDYGQIEEERDYAFRAKPTMLIYRGDYGHEHREGWSSEATKKMWPHILSAASHTLLMRGKEHVFWKSECNPWVYKSFAYGYRHNDYGPGIVPFDDEYSEMFPQELPESWDNPYGPHLAQWFEIGAARFKIYHFPAGSMKPDPTWPESDVGEYYLVVARLRKDDADHSWNWEHHAFSRGFVEVVPGHLYPSAAALRVAIQEWHQPAWKFFDSEDDDMHYLYVMMTTKERLALDPDLGVHSAWREEPGCRGGILRVESSRLLEPAPWWSGEDWAWVERDLEEVLLPRNIEAAGALSGLPLITVWELGSDYQQTGRLLVETLEDNGHLMIRTPIVKELIYQTEEWIYRFREPYWQCLELDSRSYRDPKSSYWEAQDYSDCLSPGFGHMPVVDLSVGYAHSCAVQGDGTAWCWGENSSSQLGNYMSQSIIPARVDKTELLAENEIVVEPLGEVKRIAAGGFHSCALKTDGTVWCWGRNDEGQLGDGTVESRAAPEQVVGLPPAVNLSAGYFHTCAVSIGKRVWCWGANVSGQLGDGTTENRSAPVEVPLDFVTDVSAGLMHTCAVLRGPETRSAYCWGLNQDGQLGDGTLTTRLTPTRVWQLDDPVQVSAGGRHSCAVTADHIAWCWGANDSGQLGDGTVVSRLIPVRVTGLESVSEPVQVSAGLQHGCAVEANGWLYCWGDNAAGQLGDGTTTDRLEGTWVTKVSRIGLVTAGGAHTCAAAEGEAYCFGANASGQLGNGSTQNAFYPSAVAWP